MCSKTIKKNYSEIDSLESVIKTKKSNHDTLNAELKQSKNKSKPHEKSIYNLEKWKLNQQDKIKTLKSYIKKWKTENAAL